MKRSAIRVSSKRYALKTCRICKSPDLLEFLSLDAMPIPNGFIPKKDLDKQEFHFPLKTCLCTRCWLVQLTHVVPAEIMFRNYLYIPSTSSTVRDHFSSFASEVATAYEIGKKDLVIDIGSNDGTLLTSFAKSGARILGIDPAENIVKAANRAGIPTECAFFSEISAKEICRKHGPASVITATNVIAHIDDLHDVVRGVDALLSHTGVFVMEAPYLPDLLDGNEFDTIYHEHLSYFSITPLHRLFEMHNMHIIDVQKQQIHGGSVRVFVSRKAAPYAVHPRVHKIDVEEKVQGIRSKEPYFAFAVRVKKVRSDLLRLLRKLKKEGQTVAGYGAAAKGNVLLNYSKITPDLISFIVDSISYKQGKYTPGTHIPIYAESHLLKKMPDYTLILAWNFADEIISKNAEYRARGGRFIIPVPYLRIV